MQQLRHYNLNNRIESNNRAQFLMDLKNLTDSITDNKGPDAESKLGTLLQQMSRTGLLLQRKKNEDFSIESIVLSDITKDYLNALQTEKMYKCRFCYYKNDDKRCEFHKKYIFEKDQKLNYKEYVNFLNSEMGIISFVEMYFSFLMIPFWKQTASILFKDLTGFSSIKELLLKYNCYHDRMQDIDEGVLELMDCDEQ